MTLTSEQDQALKLLIVDFVSGLPVCDRLTRWSVLALYGMVRAYIEADCAEWPAGVYAAPAAPQPGKAET